MGSRNINAVINPDTMALNALIHGYGGHSLVTPHSALQQIWWTQERIEQKVTNEFIKSRLKPKNHDRLDEPLNFGDDLSSDTYMEWIMGKGRRLFLILTEIGIPDQIFAVIDAAWDDEDLPLDEETAQTLPIEYEIHEQLDKKFYYMQFQFMLRELHEGAHFDYGTGEVVPVEYVHKLPPAVSLQIWNRVQLPKQSDALFVRRKFPLGNGPGRVSEDIYMADIEIAQGMRHDHIAPVHSSYTWKRNGYILTSFLGEHTLRTFIDHRSPAQFTKMAKHDQYCTVLGWLYCLASAIANLHTNGFRHTAIRPSNILIDIDNKIAFSDIGSLRVFQMDRKSDPAEMYIYSPPELHDISLTLFLKNHAKLTDKNLRTMSISTGGSATSSRSSSSSYSWNSRKPSLAQRLGGLSGLNGKSSSSSVDLGPLSSDASDLEEPPRASQPEEEAADIFALGCVFIELLTFLNGKKHSAFLRHRTTKIKDRDRKRMDSSYHANLDKIGSWLKTLDDAAFEQNDGAFRAVPRLIVLVKQMINAAPSARPDATSVRDKIYSILTTSGISGLCTHHQSEPSDEYGFIQRKQVNGLAVKTAEGFVKSPTETLIPLVKACSMTHIESPRTPNLFDADWTRKFRNGAF